MPVGLLIDWFYAQMVSNMDTKQREEIDAQLDAIKNADMIKATERDRRAHLARLNAQEPEG